MIFKGMKAKIDRWLKVIAWGNSLLSALFVILGILLYRANLPGGIVQRGYQPDPSNLVMAMFYPLVGAVILSKQSRHPIGWLLFWIGLLQSVQQLATQYGIYAIYTQPGPLGPLVAWVSSNTWFPGACLFVLLLMLFPNGRGLEGRWARLPWLPIACLLGALGYSATSLFSTFEGPYFDPSAVAAERSVVDFIFLVFFILLVIGFVAAGFVLLQRFRLSTGVERLQMKWFALSGTLWVFVTSSLVILDALRVLESPVIARTGVNFILPAATAAIPISMGIAILKYRLYEIDFLIRKTLVYGFLTAALAMVYLGSVVVLEGVLRTLFGQMGQSSIAIVVSTLVIAALFNPLRLKIQGGIDRRFYRRKYDAEQTLEAFAATLRDEVDLDELSTRLIQVVQETIQPQELLLWIKKDA